MLANDAFFPRFVAVLRAKLPSSHTGHSSGRSQNLASSLMRPPQLKGSRKVCHLDLLSIHPGPMRSVTPSRSRYRLCSRGRNRPGC
ncbi:hypothetical protein KC338_g251 [Hortaea werneckii]|nr:hypothetical protein KC338_g251 [Hortaea werneckii]